jgi:D-glycero-beta-D-manno-heptose 1-phosphate adenylyltransferase
MPPLSTSKFNKFNAVIPVPDGTPVPPVEIPPFPPSETPPPVEDPPPQIPPSVGDPVYPSPTDTQSGPMFGYSQTRSAVWIGKKLEQLERPIVFTNGVFDLLHAGHIENLVYARNLGACLIVAINSDTSVRRLNKGPGRPIIPQSDRLKVVASLSVVSAACIFDQDSPLSLLRLIRPDIYVKGNDYSAACSPEAVLTACWGAKTVLVPRRHPASTTGIIQKILQIH